jgi:hypothetical protein
MLARGFGLIGGMAKSQGDIDDTGASDQNAEHANANLKPRRQRHALLSLEVAGLFGGFALGIVALVSGAAMFYGLIKWLERNDKPRKGKRER